MANTDIVSIVLRLEQLRQFLSGTSQASKAVGGLGKTAEESGKKAGVGWKGIAKWAGGAAALYGAQKYIRGAVDATEELGKSTLALQRTTGMDVQTASAWASVAKSRGIATKQLQVGFVKLSKEMEKSRQGTTKESVAMQKLHAQMDAVEKVGGQKAPAALAKLQTAMGRAHDAGDKARKTLAGLGVTQKALAAGNTQAVLGQVAQGLSKIENPARRAAIAQQLFGRGGQALLPILMKGRKGIQEQLAVVRKYGAVLGVKTVGQLKDLISNQREMGIAMQGAKVQLGTALLPVLLLVTQIIVKLTRALAPLTQNATLLKVIIVALAVAFVAYKIAMLAATIAETAFNISLGLTTLWIGLIVIAIAGLVIGFIILYKRVGWFRAAVDATWAAVKTAFAAMLSAFKAVWGWVKSNWPLLLGILTGPFGLAAVIIIRHFGQIKSFVLGLVSTIKGALTDLLNFVRDLPSKIGGYLKQIPGLGKVLGLAGKVGGFVAHPHFAAGGRMPYSGTAMVGERGPELVHLPRGALVSPTAAPALAVAGTPGATAGSAEIVIPLYLDGKQIARSVARVTADKLARR